MLIVQLSDCFKGQMWRWNCTTRHCVLRTLLYGSEWWAITKVDGRRLEALDQWCLWRLLGIKWYQFVSNAELRWTTGQPLLTSTIQARSLSGNIARLDYNADAKKIRTAFPSEAWKRRLQITKQYIKSHNLTLSQYGPELPALEVAGCEWFYAVLVVQTMDAITQDAKTTVSMHCSQ